MFQLIFGSDFKLVMSKYVLLCLYMKLNCVCVVNIKDLFSGLSQNMAQPSTTLLLVTIIRQTDREREIVILRERRDGGLLDGTACTDA